MVEKEAEPAGERGTEHGNDAENADKVADLIEPADRWDGSEKQDDFSTEEREVPLDNGPAADKETSEQNDGEVSQDRCIPSCGGKCPGADDGCNGSCRLNLCDGCCNGSECIHTSDQNVNMCGPSGSMCMDCAAAFGERIDTCMNGSCMCSNPRVVCEPGRICRNHTCQADCTPDCTGKCGGADDGCGGNCPVNDCPNACCDKKCCSNPRDVCYPEAVCCTPKTCAELGYECGNPTDNCGRTLDCGTCTGCANVCDAGHHCVPASHDYYACDNGDVWWFDSCGQRQDMEQDCSGDEVCYNNACCTPDCALRCGGLPDGCGGVCNDCPAGYVCAGTSCVACGDSDQPCCNDTSRCSQNKGLVCAPSGKCKPLARIKVFDTDPGSSSCSFDSDGDYAQIGKWRTEPYNADTLPEGTDEIENKGIDYGWVVLCGIRDCAGCGVSWGGAFLARDDCANQDYSCPNGMKWRGSWHVRSSQSCAGPVVAVTKDGRSIKSGWLELCAETSMNIKAEVGSNDCGENGPGCSGGWIGLGGWHLSNGSGCGSGLFKLNGYSGTTTEAGWMRACIK